MFLFMKGRLGGLANTLIRGGGGIKKFTFVVLDFFNLGGGGC